MEEAFWIYVVIGCLAQMIDSSLGMGFGTLSSTFLLATGFPPHLISVTVHTAEIAGGGTSALSHYKMKNIDFTLLRGIALPAVIGAAVGAVLVLLTSPEKIKVIMSVYFLIIGMIIIAKTILPLVIRTLNLPVQGIGFSGGFLDAFAGAGWGEFTSSALLLRGAQTKKMIGTLNVGEFLVTLTTSAILLAGSTQASAILKPSLGLALGTIIGAPLGAWLCTRMPTKPLTILIGITICTISLLKL
jgi:uncharacterized membrane protein YfcA